MGAKYIVFLSLPSFKPFVKTPISVEYPEEKSFIELSIELDILWKRFLIENLESKKEQIKKAMPIFLDRKIIGVTQLIWNPREGILYDDVGYEILQGFDEPKMRSINDFANEKIPTESRVVIMPDAGC